VTTTTMTGSNSPGIIATARLTFLFQ